MHDVKCAVLCVDCVVESLLPLVRITRIGNANEPYAARDLAMREVVSLDRALRVFGIRVRDGCVERLQNDEAHDHFHNDEETGRGRECGRANDSRRPPRRMNQRAVALAVFDAFETLSAASVALT